MGKVNWVLAGCVLLAAGSAVDVLANPATISNSKSAASIDVAQSLAYLMEHYPCQSRPGDVPVKNNHPANRYATAAVLSHCLMQWSDQSLEPRAQMLLHALRSEFKLELAALQSAHPSAQLSRLVILGSKNVRSQQLFSSTDPQNWVAGVGIRDFVIPKSLLTFTAGQGASTLQSSTSTQMNYGAFYQFPIGEQLTLSPSVVIMANPHGSNGTPTVQGALQASFSF